MTTNEMQDIFDEFYTRAREQLLEELQVTPTQPADKNTSYQITTPPEGYEHLVLTVPILDNNVDAYNRYKLAWMLEHKHDINEFCDILTDLLYDELSQKSNYIDVDQVKDAMREAQRRFENDHGFDGELYACFPEWFKAEWSDTLPDTENLMPPSPSSSELESIMQNAASKTDVPATPRINSLEAVKAPKEEVENSETTANKIADNDNNTTDSAETSTENSTEIAEKQKEEKPANETNSISTTAPSSEGDETHNDFESVSNPTPDADDASKEPEANNTSVTRDADNHEEEKHDTTSEENNENTSGDDNTEQNDALNEKNSEENSEQDATENNEFKEIDDGKEEQTNTIDNTDDTSEDAPAPTPANTSNEAIDASAEDGEQSIPDTTKNTSSQSSETGDAADNGASNFRADNEEDANETTPDNNGDKQADSKEDDKNANVNPVKTTPLSDKTLNTNLTRKTVPASQQPASLPENPVSQQAIPTVESRTPAEETKFIDRLLHHETPKTLKANGQPDLMLSEVENLVRNPKPLNNER